MKNSLTKSFRTLMAAFVILALAVGAALFLTSCERQGGGASTSASRPGPAPAARERVPEPAPPTEKPASEPSAPPVRETQTSTGSAAPEQAAAPPSTVPATGAEIRRGPDVRKIALTFDAGASAKPTPMLLQILKKDGVPATFFLTGKWVEENPELVREIAASGFEIGNHTYSHPDLTKLTDADIREQLDKMESLVQHAAGITTKPFFRPPYGARDERVLRVASEDGYRCIYWTVDSWDAFKKGITTTEIENRVLEKAGNGSIVLMHCGSWPTVDAVDTIVKSLRQRGYELVTVSELLKAVGRVSGAGDR